VTLRVRKGDIALQSNTSNRPTAGADLTLISSQAESRRRWSVGLLSLDIYLFWFSLYLFVPILSVYAQSLGASFSMVGFIVSAYGLVQLIVRIPMGMLSDHLGRRRPFVTAAFVVVAISVVGLAWSPDPTWLLIFRGLTGLAAASWVTTTVLYTSYFPKHRSVKAIALATFFQGMSLVMATAAGGLLAESYGWVSTFYLAVIPAGLGATLSLFLADDVTLDRSKSSAFTTLRRSRGVKLLVIASILGCLAQYANYSTTFSFVPVYAAEIGAFKSCLGWLSTFVFLPQTLFSLVSARLSERLSERVLVVLGLAILGLVTLLTPFIQNVPLLIASRLVYGMGTGISFPVMMGLSIKQIEREQRASAMGVFQAVYALGMFAGPALSGVIADHLGMAGMFYSIGALCLIAAAIAQRFVPGESQT